jgi:hypothetical protein
VQTLKKASSTNGLAYRDLFCEAMAFPLVTPEDLVQWLAKLAPNVEIVLEGSQRQRKPSFCANTWD